MMTFENPILESKYVNEFGETIHMVMARDCEVYIHHDDCSNDFVKAKDFNFILSENEKIVIIHFIETSSRLIKFTY